jgi:hypothetical protein
MSDDEGCRGVGADGRVRGNFPSTLLDCQANHIAVAIYG